MLCRSLLDVFTAILPPFPSLPQSGPYYLSAGFLHVSLLWGQQTLNRLAQGDLPPSEVVAKQKQRLHLFSLNSDPNHMPHHPSVSILFLWLVLKGHTVSQDFHMSPTHPHNTLTHAHTHTHTTATAPPHLHLTPTSPHFLYLRST